MFFLEEEPKRRPGQRLTVNMMGNEVLSKEQLFDLFQQILDVKKFEHQLLYNAMQVSSSVRSTAENYSTALLASTCVS